ncbi:XRE family transcriptional regulator [Butyricicoccus sp. 1XD8-22]|nr:XRE family transcriptional regulator [Butyricicoccus sp. 1XD8-22]
MKDILGEISRLRQERGWTEYELSKRTGIPQPSISTWYRKKQMITIPTLEKVCKAFDITLSQFFDEGENTGILTPEQREMLDHWSVLDEEQQKIILELLKQMGKLSQS